VPAVAVIDKSELTSRLSRILDPSQEIFCNEVAAGVPATTAAVTSGYCAGYADDLLQKDYIRSRVEELLTLRDMDGGGIATRAWIETQMVWIVRQAVTDTPASIGPDGVSLRPARQMDLNLALTALNSLAKFKGYIVDKSSKLTANIDLTKLPPNQVQAAIRQRLDALSPGARKRIESALPTDTIDASPEDE
jgi:hypothetical protein